MSMSLMALQNENLGFQQHRIEAGKDIIQGSEEEE